MLVIHGRDDTLITPEGGERTAELVPGSRYLLLSDMGHDHPAPLWPVLAEAIGGHVRTSTDHPSIHESELTPMAGPLTGYRIIEIAGIGPGPFAAMLLADLGAEVIRVERAGAVRGPLPEGPHFDVLLRGRKNVAIDLKHPDGVEALLTLVESADALIEGFRPGVMERLGVGPDDCLARNPKLVFGRMTGWGQDGPVLRRPPATTSTTSHSPARSPTSVERGEAPVPPLNMVGDFGGGGMFLAYGVVCALLEAQRSGQGQVVDTAMVDGAAVLMSMFWAFKSIGMHDENARGTNLLDTGAHFYDVYRCSDGEYISLGSIEPQFYAELLRLTGLDGDEQFAKQMDKAEWPALKSRLTEVFAQKTRAEWCELMEDTDVCFAPVLTMSEAAEHPHNVERQTFIDVAGTMQPAPAPRFSRTEAEVASPPAHAGSAHARGVRGVGCRERCDRRMGRRRSDSSGWLIESSTWPTLVCFHAHPDDEVISTGGTIARAAAEGHRVVLVVATNGDHRRGARRPRADGETLVDRRRAETEASAKALGIERVVWLGYTDSGMTGWEQNGDPEQLPSRRADEAGARLAEVLARRVGRRVDDLRLARQLRPPRPHRGAPGGAGGGASWCRRCGCSRRR